MLMKVLLRCIQTMEHIRDNGFSRFMRDLICLNRKAIVAEKDLDEEAFAEDLFSRCEIRFLDVTRELLKNGHFRFVARNRYLKALEYLKKGYEGHAIARGNEIIGDIWYYPTSPMSNVTGHTDLRWLGIKLEYGCVYSFDIYLALDSRGENLAAALQRSSMHSLRQKGFTRAFAYYWADNTSAVWTTRVVNNWKEYKVLRVRNIFLNRKIIKEESILDLSRTVNDGKD